MKVKEFFCSQAGAYVVVIFLNIICGVAGYGIGLTLNYEDSMMFPMFDVEAKLAMSCISGALVCNIIGLFVTKAANRYDQKG